MKLNPVTIEFFHKRKYVNFKSKSQVDDSQVTVKKDFYNQLKELKEKGFTQIEHTTIKRNFKINNFALTEKGHYLRLTWRDKEGFHQRYTNFKDDSKNNRNRTPVFQEFTKMFKDNNNIKFNEAFGNVPQDFKRCVPGLFHYDNPNYVLPGLINTVMSVGKLDFSSHFPGCACGLMPDANTSMRIEGYAEPTKEYPFAFYIKSGFVAEYGEYNSRDWYYTKYKTNLFESEDRKFIVKPVSKEEEITILMKPAQYILDAEMQYYYDKKSKCTKGTEEYEEAKIILLKIVGMLEMNDPKEYNNRPYAHLAAVIKARAIHKMLKLIERVGDKNVISVIVDGLIFNNRARKHYADKFEYIGSLKEEAFNALGHFKGHNQYVLSENGVIDIAHAGYDINVNQPDMRKWRKSPAVHIRDMITEELKIEIEDLNTYEKY